MEIEKKKEAEREREYYGESEIGGIYKQKKKKHYQVSHGC